MNVAAVVPSFNPDEKFITIIDRLIAAGFTRIYVVNDGSDKGCDVFFTAAAARPQCVLLTHPENRGKGRALKTAFERHLESPGGYVGVVTLDADGQHSAEDTVKVADALAQNPEALVLGARNFSQSDVPKKSALGNKITRKILSAACGVPITDTQTGLRGIPNRFIQTLLGVNGDRYEFETNMLLETKRSRVSIVEVPISTIYINNNSASHFRPFKDSLRIYLLILMFTFASMASSLADLCAFGLLFWLLRFMPNETRIFLATVIARIISATFNFFINHRLVFRSKTRIDAAALRYAVLCVLQMLCSFGGVYLLSRFLPLPALLAKIITDVPLFFISFFIQRRWVFRAGPAA
jgi:putative flippase GtrA